MKKKVVSFDVSANHAAFLLVGGYVMTMGDNKEGQLGLGHTKDAPFEPSLVKGIKDKFVTVWFAENFSNISIFQCELLFQNIKCSSTYTVITTDSNVVLGWGTRYGIPEFHFSEVPPTPRTPSTFSQIGNNTAAFTNFLTSVYKSETMLEAKELLGLYSSNDLLEQGIFLKVVDVFPLQHSILILVDTTTPLKSSN